MFSSFYRRTVNTNSNIIILYHSNSNSNTIIVSASLLVLLVLVLRLLRRVLTLYSSVVCTTVSGLEVGWFAKKKRPQKYGIQCYYSVRILLLLIVMFGAPAGARFPGSR